MKIIIYKKITGVCFRLLLMPMLLSIKPVMAIDAQTFWNGACAGAPAPSALATMCLGISHSGNTGGVLTTGQASNASNFDNSGAIGGETKLDAIASQLQKRIEKRKMDQMVASPERLSLYINGMTSQTDREDTFNENGYDGDESGFTVGLDYFFSNALLAGVSVKYTDLDIDYTNQAGHLDTESVSITAYTNYSPIANLDIDGYVGWTGGWQESSRNFNLPSITSGTATGDTQSNKFSAGIGANYGLRFGKLKLTPRVALLYSNTWIDAYDESSTNSAQALRFGEQTVHSLKTNAGVSISYPFSQTWGVWTPQIRVFHVHEYDDDSRLINASLIEDTSSTPGPVNPTDSPDRDYVTLAASLSTVLKHGVQLFIDYQRIEAHRFINNYTITGGVRVSF